MNLEELKEALKKHEMWLEDKEGGEIADLHEANLSDTDLRGADLSLADLGWANLRDTDLRGADLSLADLGWANLRGADLRGADLRGANLESVNLWGATGNSKQIKTINVEKYFVNYTKSHIQIGCKNHSIEEWFSFSDDEISEMDVGSLAWWKKWKDIIKQIIEMSPAEE